MRATGSTAGAEASGRVYRSASCCGKQVAGRSLGRAQVLCRASVAACGDILWLNGQRRTGGAPRRSPRPHASRVERSRTCAMQMSFNLGQTTNSSPFSPCPATPLRAGGRKSFRVFTLEWRQYCLLESPYSAARTSRDSPKRRRHSDSPAAPAGALERGDGSGGAPQARVSTRPPASLCPRRRCAGRRCLRLNH